MSECGSLCGTHSGLTVELLDAHQRIDVEAAACLTAHRSNWDLDKHSEGDDESPVASD